MSYQLKLSSEAEENMREQCLWYEADERRGGFELSSRWLETLISQLDTLKQNPERFPFAPENGKWAPTEVIRQMLFRPWKNKAGWRVLYVIIEKKKVVSVLQIRHERRKWLHDPE